MLNPWQRHLKKKSNLRFSNFFDRFRWSSSQDQILKEPVKKDIAISIRAYSDFPILMASLKEEARSISKLKSLVENSHPNKLNFDERLKHKDSTIFWLFRWEM